MQKIGDIVGLPVLDIETGTQMGEVEDVIVDLEKAKLDAFIMTGEQWFAHPGAIAFDHICSVGRDAMMVRNQRVIQQLDALSTIHSTYYVRDLSDKEIFTESGIRLGVLADLIFDHQTGEIKGYQLSDNIIDDLLHGRMMMPLPTVQVIGRDRVIVPECMGSLLHGESRA